MSSPGLTTSELAARVRGYDLTVKVTEHKISEYLHEWEARGIAECVLGRWRLTRSGRAMFAFWADLNGDGWNDIEEAA